ncbi:MAG: hypothetical protein ACM3JB_02435 [Acidobacteriaceae bacterium]
MLGSIDRLVDEAAARQAISALCVGINAGDARIKASITTVSELAEHYRQRELKPDTVWKTYSTKVTYEGYLNKWILPRWGEYPIVRVNAGEVELWLRSLPLARASCAKIRNLMSVLFNHGIRYGSASAIQFSSCDKARSARPSQSYWRRWKFRGCCALWLYGKERSYCWHSALVCG